MSAFETLVHLISWALMIAGSAFVIIGALGTLRLPDFWSRMHGASITDSAGMILMVAGMSLEAGLTLITVKLIIIGVFLFITGPTSTHAIANAALVTGLRPPEGKGLRSAKRDQPEAPRKATGKEGAE